MELQKQEKNAFLIPLRTSVIATKEFKETLQNICYLIGIREAIDNYDMDRLFIYLNKNFGMFNLNEINEAFDLYSAQKLSFKDSHFNSFDKVFIGKVLNAYAERNNLNRTKPKRIDNVNEKYEWTYNDKKSHFEWLRDEVFLKGNKFGVIGTFPDILICSFKDVFDYMESQNFIKKLDGEELKKRIKEIEILVNAEIKNSKKKVNYNNLINLNKGSLPATYYRYEVMDWFKKNREEIINNN